MSKSIINTVRRAVIVGILLLIAACFVGAFAPIIERPTIVEGAPYYDGKSPQALNASEFEAGILVELEDTGFGYFKARLLKTGQVIFIYPNNITYKMTTPLATVPWGTLLGMVMAAGMWVWIYTSFTSYSIPNPFVREDAFDFLLGSKEVKGTIVYSRGGGSVEITVFYVASTVVMEALIPNIWTLIRYWLGKKGLNASLNAQVVGDVLRYLKEITPLEADAAYAYASNWTLTNSDVADSLARRFGVIVTDVKISRFDMDATAMSVVSDPEAVKAYWDAVQKAADELGIPPEKVAELLARDKEAKARLLDAEAKAEVYATIKELLGEPVKQGLGGLGSIGTLARAIEKAIQALTGRSAETA